MSLALVHARFFIDASGLVIAMLPRESVMASNRAAHWRWPEVEIICAARLSRAPLRRTWQRNPRDHQMNLAMIAPGGIGIDAQSVQESLAMRRCFYRCGWEIQEAYGDGAPVATRSRYAAVPGERTETDDDYSRTHGAVLSGSSRKNRLVM